MLISKKIEDTHREKLHYCLPYLRQKKKRSYIPEYRSYKPALLCTSVLPRRNTLKQHNTLETRSNELYSKEEAATRYSKQEAAYTWRSYITAKKKNASNTRATEPAHA